MNSLSTENLSYMDVKSLVVQKLEKLPLKGDFTFEKSTLNEKVQKSTSKWILEQELIPQVAIEKFNQYAISDLTCGAYQGADYKKLKIITRWVLMLFINDDINEKVTPEKLASINERSLSCMRGACKDRKTSLERGFYSIAEKTRKLADADWLQSLIDVFARHFDSTEIESRNRENKNLMNFEEYKKNRALTGGAEIAFSLIEFNLGINLYKKKFDQYLKEVSNLCNNILCWSNDIISLPKEFKEDPNTNNLVLILKKENDCSIEEAIDLAIDLHNKEVQSFLHKSTEIISLLEKEILPEGDSEMIIRYIQGLKNWIGSHHAWAHESPRYGLKK